MKKNFSLLIILAILLSLPVLGLAETVVASFFPVYLFARNLTVGIEELDLYCLAAPGTGCLHDYQLTTADMKALTKADLFLINGGAMESYLQFVFEALPDLPVVDASVGVPLLEDDDGEEEVNAHFWLHPAYAITMVNNLAQGLITAYPQYAETIQANQENYTQRLETVYAQLQEGLAPLQGTVLITFHEAFPYFAQAFHLEIGAVITHDADEALSAYQLRQLIQLVASLGNPPLFVEPQYDDIVAQTISAETGSPIYTLDPCVTGPQDDTLSLTLYEDTLLADMEVLLTAFGK